MKFEAILNLYAMLPQTVGERTIFYITETSPYKSNSSFAPNIK